jgi:hypothetical protein
MLKSGLMSQVLTAEARTLLKQPWKNYYEMWTGQFADKFHDMTTMVRLGGAIEEELRSLYMRRKGYANLLMLNADKDFRHGVFQRVMPWQAGPGSARHLLQLSGYELTTNSKLATAQRIMLHRHLYAHNLGVIDDRYITDWEKLTCENLRSLVAPYPAEDVYWFRPLDELGDAIEIIRGFVQELV